LDNGKVKLFGSFGVFFAGQLIAHFYNQHGAGLGTLAVADVNPTKLASLNAEIMPPGKPARVSLHLQDAKGLDHGSLGEIQITRESLR